MGDAYNKALCEERQIHRNREVNRIVDIQNMQQQAIKSLQDAVLILTNLAQRDKINKIVTIALVSVIVVLAVGKEVAALLIAAALR